MGLAQFERENTANRAAHNVNDLGKILGYNKRCSKPKKRIPMLEVNQITLNLADLVERTQALRGYL